jgi:poly-gamma-glutamate synthesis protein (capsule biosynthesis protein)
MTACQPIDPTQLPTPSSPAASLPSPTPRQTNTTAPTSTPNSGYSTQSFTPTIESDSKVTLMAVGDIMLGRTIGEMIEAEGVEAPFVFTEDVLSQADITLGNLECPISDRGSPEKKNYAFRAPLAAGKSLAYAGFDLVSLANNHILDFGTLGLEDTLETLKANNILAVGAGMDEDSAYSPVFAEINGIRLAFLAFMDVSEESEYDYIEWEAGLEKPGVAWAHKNKIRDYVQKAKQEADLVIVLMHNGYEIIKKVFPNQQEVARLAIDSGATLVIGSHPHVLQSIEAYKDGLIVYSMGNFVFDNFLFPPNYSAILSVELSPQGIESYELIDVIVQLNGVPQIMEYDLDE